MSYLLEALRKSERERQENRAVPGLQTPTVEWEGRDDGRSRSPWLMVAVVAICLNTVLLALLVWRFGFAESESAAISTPATTTNAPASTNPAGQTTMPAVIVVQQPREPAPAVVVRERAPEEQQSRSTATVRPSDNVRALPPATRTSTATVGSSRDGAAAEPAPLSNGVDSASDTPPPNVNALPVEIRQQLPLLTMNSHIYASNARDSFVMINGVSLNPGDEISAGLRLIAVVPEGAVLAINGQRFLLPALASFSP